MYQMWWGESESKREREQSLCPLTQRVCLNASIADGASEYAITTPMTDISLTLESFCMEKQQRRRRLYRKVKEHPTIHLMPAPLHYEPITVMFTGGEHSVVQEATITLFSLLLKSLYSSKTLGGSNPQLPSIRFQKAKLSHLIPPLPSGTHHQPLSVLTLFPLPPSSRFLWREPRSRVESTWWQIH